MRLPAAADLAKLRYETLRDRLGENHPDTYAELLEVARSLAAQPGSADEAVETYLTLVRRLWEEAGHEDPRYVEILHEAADVVHRAGHVDRAASMLRYVVAIRTHVSGPDHPDTLRAARTLNRIHPVASQGGRHG